MPTGQAVVTLNGKDHYLGLHGTDESQEKYNRTIAQWLQQGARGLAVHDQKASRESQTTYVDVTVNEIIVRYLLHCDIYYQRSPTEIEKIKLVLRGLRDLYRQTIAGRFGPLSLKAIQTHFAETLSRRTVNTRGPLLPGSTTPSGWCE